MATNQNYCTNHIFESFTTLENIAATIKPICTFRLQKCGTLVASLFTLNMNNHINLKVVLKPTEITFICRQINFTFVAQLNLLELKLEKNETEEFLGQSFLENIRIIFGKNGVHTLSLFVFFLKIVPPPMLFVCSENGCRVNKCLWQSSCTLLCK